MANKPKGIWYTGGPDRVRSYEINKRNLSNISCFRMIANIINTDTGVCDFIDDYLYVKKIPSFQIAGESRFAGKTTNCSFNALISYDTLRIYISGESGKNFE